MYKDFLQEGSLPTGQKRVHTLLKSEQGYSNIIRKWYSAVLANPQTPLRLKVHYFTCIIVSLNSKYLHSPCPFFYISFEIDMVFIWNYKMHVCCKTSLIQFFSTKARLNDKY
jgi:hypothetical protein